MSKSLLEFLFVFFLWLMTGESWWVTHCVRWCLLADIVALAIKRVCARVCLWQVVNYTHVFVHWYMFPRTHTHTNMHTDHRPDRQVLISCQGRRWCVLTVTVLMTESPASEQRGMLGLTQGPLSHHAVCLCFKCVCKSSDWRKWGSLSVSSLLVSQWICQGEKD